MKKYKLLLFLLLSFLACNDDPSFFEPSTDGLKLAYKSVPGGAILKYSLPNNHNIFSMNVRYQDNNGKAVLKSSGYSGDSILLDGFTQGKKVLSQIYFLDNYGKESTPFDFEFVTDDSAPWTFFNRLEVNTSWNGFTVSYGPTTVATGIAHIFYLGNNPLTQKLDTILVGSFPINAKGDTLNLVVKQESPKNTIVVRTEDFAGYRVKQEIFPDIQSFNTEKMTITAANFDDGGLSVENKDAKTGIKYLFDGELKGRERMLAPPPAGRAAQVVFGTYVAGPHAVGHPFIIDLKTEKIPAKLRLYCLYRMMRLVPPGGEILALGKVWNGFYQDKLPCNVTVYGSNNPADTEGWKELGTLAEDPLIETPWYNPPKGTIDPTTVDDLDSRDPIFIDINFPPVNNSYRYIKMVINDTFRIPRQPIDYNTQKYITLMELEVYVKKD